MYLRVIKAHISRIFNELDKQGNISEYFEKIEVDEEIPLISTYFVSLC